MAESIVIGRACDCDMVLADESVSRHHAELTRTDEGRLLLTDRISANGTFIMRGGEPQPVKQAEVRESDEVRLGDVDVPVAMLLEVLAEKSQPVSPEPARGQPAAPSTPLARRPSAPDPVPAPEPGKHSAGRLRVRALVQVVLCGGLAAFLVAAGAQLGLARLVAVPFVFCLTGLLELMTGVPFYQLAARWDSLPITLRLVVGMAIGILGLPAILCLMVWLFSK